MKKTVMVVAIAVAVSTLSAAAAPALKTKKQRLSYAMGYRNGLYLKNNNPGFNLSLYAQGLSDAVNGTKPLMSKAAIKSHVNTYMKARIAQFKKQYQAQMQQAKKSMTFFKANAKKPGVKTTASGLQYKVITPGTGPKPKLTDQVVVDYTGSYPDGTVFDSSAKHGGPATFPVNGVVPGFKEALMMMPVGSTWKVFIPPHLGYGPRGIPGAIKPNAILVFDLHLRKIK